MYIGLVGLLGVACSGGCQSPSPPAVRPALGATSHALTVTPIPAGSLWERESTHALQWSSPAARLGSCGADEQPLCPLALIEESHDQGATWTYINEVWADVGRYVWNVPIDGPSRARFRITLTSTTEPERVVLGQVDTEDVTFIPSQKRNYTWTHILNDAPWGPRDGAGAIVYGGKMWLIGGWNGDRFPLVTANDVWSSTDGVNWIEEKPNTFLNPETFDRANDWEGRHYGGYQVHDGKMWIIGGDTVQGHYQTDVWNSVDGRRWTRTDIHTTIPYMMLDDNTASETYGQQIPVPGWRPAEEAQFGRRAFQITGVFDGKLWLMGGQRTGYLVDPLWPGAPSGVFNDLWSSTDGATWTETPTVGPMWAPRGMVDNAVSFDGRMWLIGGGTYEDEDAGRSWREFYNDIWSTADGVHWEKTPELPPFTTRTHHNVTVFDGRLWVIGGYDDWDNREDAWYTADGRNWYDGSGAGFVPRHAASAWVHNGNMYIGAGNAFGWEEHDPDTGIWRADVWKVTVAP